MTYMQTVEAHFREALSKVIDAKRSLYMVESTLDVNEHPFALDLEELYTKIDDICNAIDAERRTCLDAKISR